MNTDVYVGSKKYFPLEKKVQRNFQALLQLQVLPRMRCSEVQMWQWGNEAFTRQRRVNLGNNGHHCTGQTFATTFPSWLLQIVKRLLLWHAFSFFLPQLWSQNMYVRYSRVQIYQIRAPDLTFKFWLERLTCFSCRPGKASPGPGRNLDSSCKLGYCNPCRFIILVAGLLIKADLHTAPLLMILPSSARQRPQLREGSAVQSVPTWL